MAFINPDAKSKFESLLKDNQIEYRKKDWINFTGNVVIKDAVVIRAKTASEVSVARVIINDFNEKYNGGHNAVMRNAGGGLGNNYSQSFSMTPCVQCDVVLEIVGDLNHNDNIRKIKIIDAKNHIVQVGANVSVEDVDNILYRNKDNPMTLPTASLIGKVSVIGLASNAGHGVGIHQEAVAGLILGMEFITPNGQHIRILPPDEDGLEKEVESRDGVKTICHPDFYEIRGSSLGIFGTLISVDVQCVPAQKMQTVKEPRTNEQLVEELKKGLLLNNQYTSVMMIPKYNKSSQKNICIRRQTPVPLSTPNSHSHPDLENIEQKFLIGASEAIRFTEVLSSNPKFTPTAMDEVAATQVPSTDTIEVGDWPSQVHYQTQYPHDIDNFDYLFEVSPDSREVVRAVNFMNGLLDEFAANKQYPVVFAGYIRAIKGTQGGLSTSAHEEGKYIVGFDIVSNRNIPGYPEFKKRMEYFFINELKAKPHWGKTVDTALDYRQIYGEGRFDKFKNVLQRWYKRWGDFTLENNSILNRFWNSILQVVPKLQNDLQSLFEAKSESKEREEQKLGIPSSVRTIFNKGVNANKQSDEMSDKVSDKSRCCVMQ